MNFLKNTTFLLIAVVSTVLTVGCKTIQYVPVETIKEVHIKDSVYFRDTLVRVELEKARLADFVDLGDTLVLQTDLARSTAFLDSASGKLKGTLENIKRYAEKNVPLKEKVVYKDSVVTKEVPVPVEVEKVVKVVPWFFRVCTVIGLLAMCTLALWAGFKFL